MKNFKKQIYKAHTDINQKYDDLSYIYHLKMSKQIYDKFKHLIDEQDFTECAVIGHDSIEDTPLTYSDVKKFSNERIADMIYAVTNEKGKSRKERANAKYYKDIRDTKNATFVKLCDRIANILYSKLVESSMYKKYIKEMTEFKKELYDVKYKEMFDFIDYIISLNFKYSKFMKFLIQFKIVRKFIINKNLFLKIFNKFTVE